MEGFKIKPKILVVEDNQDILFNIQLILNLNGYEVETALNGEEAVKILSQMVSLPDLILSDIIMPKMNGYEFFKELSTNAKYRNIPFIFASAKSTPEDIRLGKLIGAQDYITKPFREKELLEKIHDKIDKAKILEKFDIKIREVLKELKNNTNINESIIIEEKYYLYLIMWDGTEGLKLHNSFPIKENKTITIKKISENILKIFNQLKIGKKIFLPETILIDLDEFNKQGFFYYDEFNDLGVQKEFIIALIGPDLSYLKSLKLKNLFASIASEFKENLKVDLSISWDGLLNSISE